MSENSVTREIPEAIAALPRQQRRHWLRQQAKAELRQEKQRRVRPCRPRRIDLLTHLFPVAQGMLMSSAAATPPKFRAIAKMARYLIASPLHHKVTRHQRGSWRSWPQRIGAQELADIATRK